MLCMMQSFIVFLFDKYYWLIQMYIEDMRLVWICLKGFFKKTKIVEKKFLSVSQGYTCMIYNVC